MIEIINYLSGKKIIIVCGHYGAGKTNIAVNLAVKLKERTGFACTLADMDIVNPYFRSADNIKELQEHGVDFIIPQFANTNVDLPAIPAEIYSVFADNKNAEKLAVIDVGGDGNGAVVLGMFEEHIKRETPGTVEMIYVVNKYRPLTGEVESAVNLAKTIENKSKLKITSLINNSNIGNMTTGKNILDSIEYAQKISDLLNVTFIGTSYLDDINIDVDFLEKEEYNIFNIKNHTKNLF